MPVNNLPSMILDAVSRHLPAGAAWLPIAAAVIMGGFGLLFMIKGARLAPVLAALVFALVGGGAGPFVANLTNAPLWPVVAGCGLVGLFLGVLLFRVWLAVLVGACLILTTLTIYAGQVLRDPLNAYLSTGFDREQQLVTLPEPGDAGAAATAWTVEVSRLWNHLSANVPNFQVSFMVLVLSAGVAGLVFGLVFPKLARAIWAASFGIGLLLVGVYGALYAAWPAAIPAVNQWGPIVGGVLWALAVVYNLADIGLFARKPAPAPEPAKATA